MTQRMIDYWVIAPENDAEFVAVLDPIREAHGLTVRHLGARNPSLEPILRTYAEVLEHFGQRREAKQMLRHADDIIRESAALNLTGYTVDARVYH